MTGAAPSGPGLARVGSPLQERIRLLPQPGVAKIGGAADLTRAVQAELDHPGGDLARAVAAGIAGDGELGGEGVEAPLGGPLADLERGGHLGTGGRAAGEGALAAVGGDE